MASKAIKTPLLRAVNRNYASKSAAQPVPFSGPEVKTTVLPNKISVVTVGEPAAVSRVSVLFRAGSRNETPDNLGATHMLRMSSGLSTKNLSTFGITRNLQQIGSNLSSSTDREIVSYTLECTQENLDAGLNILQEVAAQQVFKPWELRDLTDRIRYELASLRPEVKVLDLLHKAAYRRGLGNSLFMPEYAVGKISSETLQHYVSQTFTAPRTAVLGQGVDHSQLVEFANCLSLENKEGPTQCPDFHGGEIRLETSGDIAHVAVAVEGAGLKSPKDVLTLSILQYCYGDGPSTKWGTSSASLTKAVTKCVPDTPFAVSGLNINFSDSGLFGFVASAPYTVIGKVVEGCMSVLRCGDVLDVDYERAKSQLRSTILYSGESGSSTVRELGTQVLLLGKTTGAETVASAVDAIVPADVCSAAKKVRKGKIAMAAIGRIDNVPYISEMK